MICEKCGQAGDVRREDPEESRQLHEQCKGWCDCNHKVEGEWLQMEFEKHHDE